MPKESNASDRAWMTQRVTQLGLRVTALTGRRTLSIDWRGIQVRCCLLRTAPHTHDILTSDHSFIVIMHLNHPSIASRINATRCNALRKHTPCTYELVC
jgi:hypothetical protein